jgi:hypothetical protein
MPKKKQPVKINLISCNKILNEFVHSLTDVSGKEDIDYGIQK